MQKNRKRNIFILALCISMVFASFAGAYGATSAQKKAEAKAFGDKAQEAMEKADSVEAKAVIMQEQIDEKKKEIEATQEKVTKKEAEIDSQTEALNQRLSVMYKTGTIGIVDVILSSDSMEELLMNVGLVQKILRSDQDIQKGVADELAELEALKKQLDEQKAQLDAQKAELDVLVEQYRAEADAAKAEQEKLNAEAAALLQEELANQPNVPYTPPASGSYTWPTRGVISDDYGWRICPFHGEEFHDGLDIASSTGTPIYAIADGVVGTANWYGGYGNCVTISHGGGLQSLYGHMNTIYVSRGESVSRGQQIGTMGSTGNSTGPHLHFTVYMNGSSINPWSLY